MLTLLFGAMVAVLLSALLILIFIRQSERKDQREQQRGVGINNSGNGHSRLGSGLVRTWMGDHLGIPVSAGYNTDVLMLTVPSVAVIVVLLILMFVKRMRKQEKDGVGICNDSARHDVLFVVVLIFGAVIVILLSVLVFIIVKNRTRDIHSLQYIYTGVTPGISFPEFTLVGLLDGEEFVYYDSDTKKMIPKTEWMKKAEDDDPDYWARNTQQAQGSQENFKVSLDTAMKRYNHTEGLHTVQWMYGCELGEDGSKREYDRYGYDGEDFLSLDLITGTWTAANAKAVITKWKWENSYTAVSIKNYLENECPDWLMKYVGYSRSTPERKVRPEVSVFQKDSSSPVVCHATGFYPKPVMISWQKNGEDLDEGVELRETLPNLDGTFQKRSILTVSPEELKENKYTCIIQHSSLEKEMVLQVSDCRVLHPVPPKTDLFQKDSSSPVVCHATGFYPKPVNITWKKNGEDLDEGVVLRETLPNQDGTFQRSSILTVSPAELDKHNYTSIIQHSSLEKGIVLQVSDRRVLSGGLFQRNTLSETETVLDIDAENMLLPHTLCNTSILKSKEKNSFPEFTAVGLLDGEQIVYYDSNIRKMIPKFEWMEKAVGDEPDYCNRNTQQAQGSQEVFRVSLAIAMQRYNHTEGVHTLQRMYGCELDDDRTKRGYDQYGYDGEDFLSLDLNTGTWTAVNAKAVTIRQKWEETFTAAYAKNYLESTCIDELNKYMEYGRSTLERKVPPKTDLFQKDSSSPVVCHATGFYPKAVMISWKKNGEDLHEDVEHRETLPNQDRTFQKRSILTLSPEELDSGKYTCVIQHVGLEKEIVLQVSDRRVLSGKSRQGSVDGLMDFIDTSIS
ncbi:hypothetical protein NFI96_022743 [Prochilodus magdalenae]|nr:hypothetical protein NFI96_022743 [Prochilodus magdalenae]